jgi:hypothetical protein
VISHKPDNIFNPVLFESPSGKDVLAQLGSGNLVPIRWVTFPDIVEDNGGVKNSTIIENPDFGPLVRSAQRR